MANEFVIRIRADDAATATVNKIKAALSKVTDPVDKVQQRVGKLGNIGQAGLSKLEKGFRGAATAAGKVVDKIVEIVPGLAAIGGAASLAGLSALAARFGVFGFNLNKSSKLLGMNAQDLAAWHVAAKRAGVSADEFDSAMNGSQMAIRAAASGADPHAMLMMQKMGVQIARNKDGTVDYYTTQLRLMKAIQAQKTVEAQRDAANTFSMGGLLPMIQNGTWDADKARAYRKGLVPSADEIAKAKAFNEDVSDLRGSVEGLGNGIGSALIPVLDPVVKAMSQWLDQNRAEIADKISAAVQRFVDWISKINWNDVTAKASSFYDSIGGIKGVAVALAAITFAGPIAGVLSLISKLVMLTTVTIPGAATALARLAGGPVMAAIFALLHSDGLNTGEDDYLNAHRAQPGQQWGGDAVAQARATANSGSVTDREKYLLGRLKSAGYTDAQASGMIGSLLQENGTLDPSATNAKSGNMGIAQWGKARAKLFQQQFGHSLTGSTFGEQVDFMLSELNNTENLADRRIRNAQTPEQAAAIHAMFYERPGTDEANIPRRQALANSVFAKLPQLADAAPPAGPTETASDAPESTPSTQPDDGHDASVAALQKMAVDVTFHGVPHGIRAEAKAADGSYMPTKVNYRLDGI